jgi:hypothetical protein
MADFTKSRRSKLPPPPAPSEAKDNLTQPEHAPVPEPTPWVDGRTLRATGRTTQFTTRVTSEFLKEIKLFAVKHDLNLNEVLEKAFAALKREMA